MDYIRYHATINAIDFSLVISIPKIGLGSMPLEQHPYYVAPDAEWAWVDMDAPEVQVAIEAWNAVQKDGE